MSAAFSTEVVETKLLTPQLRLVSVSYPELRRGGGGRRDRCTYALEATTMLALGLVLNTLGIGLFCWAIFALAVYALPFFVAVSTGTMAFHGGAGIVAAVLVGMASGALTLAVAQVAVAFSRSLILRIAIASAFAVPAALAGYHLMFGLSQIGQLSLDWREALACVGAVCIGGTAWTRLTVFTEVRPSTRSG
ncbi:hypothetical protein [Bradyrhizobium yuanmingense]|uniref:hypothetical protein n=1 Tax=Bradyrhizobium yuanmingense TaxID=108015 RepID=UPI0023B8DC6E|nr:hypothetical protein [Bradyrhizobium yuanmingense]MDF0579249.1 hypothetical protein [Bradyrhizobium yuanmingense]